MARKSFAGLLVGWLALGFYSCESFSQQVARDLFERRRDFLMTPDRTQIVANGKSTVSIVVRVEDRSIPDGTVVKFTSTLPDTVFLPKDEVMLRRGIARVVLRAGTTPGIATVTAFFGASRESVDIQVLPPGAAQSRGAQVILVKSEYLMFDPNQNFVTCSGKSRFVYQGLEVRADVRLEAWLNQGLLSAYGQPGQNTVSVSNGTAKLEGDIITLDFMQQVGVLIRARPESEQIGFRSVLLERLPEDKIADLQTPEASYDINRTWIKAKELVVHPQEKIVVRRAQFFWKGNKLITLPLHVIPLSSAGLAGGFGTGYGNQFFSYNGFGGLQIDFPVYYRADLNGTGAVRIQHFGGRGFGAFRPGFSLALEEQYVLGERAEGAVMLDQIIRKDWGIRAQHFQQIGQTSRLTAFLDFPRHKDLFGRFNYMGSIGETEVGAELFFNTGAFGSGVSTQTFFQLPTGTLGKTGIGYSIVANAAFNTGGSGFSDGLSEGIDFDLLPPSLQLGRFTSVTFRLGESLFHSNRGLSTSFKASASLRRQLGMWGSLDLSYTFDQGTPAFGSGFSTQSLNLTFLANPTRTISLNAFGTHSLSSNTTYGSASIWYQFHKDWQARFELSFQKFGGSSFTDFGVSLARRLGNMEVSLNWQKSRGKIFFEFNPFGMFRF